MVFDEPGLEGLAKRIYGEDAAPVLAALKADFPNLNANGRAGVLSGIQFHNAAVDQALIKAAQSSQVYSYWFTYNPPAVLDGRIGAPHCADIPYFFDNAALCDQQTGNSPEANSIADLMSDALVQFAATGNPSRPQLAWPSFSPERRETMVFDVQSRVENYPGRRVFRSGASRITAKERVMDDHVYKIVELVGTSSEGVGEAVENALQRASKTVRNIRWFETLNIRGSVENGKVKQFQVTVKIGFTLD